MVVPSFLDWILEKADGDVHFAPIDESSDDEPTDDLGDGTCDRCDGDGEAPDPELAGCNVEGTRGAAPWCLALFTMLLFGLRRRRTALVVSDVSRMRRA